MRCEKPDPRPPNPDLPIVTVGGRGSSTFRRFATVGRVLAVEDPVFELLVRNPEAEPFRITTRLYQKAVTHQPLSDTGSDLASVTSRVARGEDVTREELIQATTMATSFAVIAQPPAERCEVRLLEAPIFDDGWIIVFGDPKNEDEVAIFPPDTAAHGFCAGRGRQHHR
ncbi:MAG: hypothetical protein GEU75_03630 [Dehalococcoidia bacterium]|nr:hypothetical protein [Dehalococcoidia bacterium]